LRDYTESPHFNGVEVQACENINEIIDKIKQNNISAGVALRPGTLISSLHGVDLNQADVVLIMTVEPGFGGQAFIPASLKKISECKVLLLQGGYHAAIQVDGGVNEQTAIDCIKAGADNLVAGTAIFGNKDRKQVVNALRGILL
jgi:ribulose-phosphate 3-epimerase